MIKNKVLNIDLCFRNYFLIKVYIDTEKDVIEKMQNSTTLENNRKHTNVFKATYNSIFQSLHLNSPAKFFSE